LAATLQLAHLDRIAWLTNGLFDVVVMPCSWRLHGPEPAEPRPELCWLLGLQLQLEVVLDVLAGTVHRCAYASWAASLTLIEGFYGLLKATDEGRLRATDGCDQAPMVSHC